MLKQDNAPLLLARRPARSAPPGNTTGGLTSRIAWAGNLVVQRDLDLDRRTV